MSKNSLLYEAVSKKILQNFKIAINVANNTKELLNSLQLTNCANYIETDIITNIHNQMEQLSSNKIMNFAKLKPNKYKYIKKLNTFLSDMHTSVGNVYDYFDSAFADSQKRGNNIEELISSIDENKQQKFLNLIQNAFKFHDKKLKNISKECIQFLLKVELENIKEFYNSLKQFSDEIKKVFTQLESNQETSTKDNNSTEINPKKQSSLEKAVQEKSTNLDVNNLKDTLLKLPQKQFVDIVKSVIKTRKVNQ